MRLLLCVQCPHMYIGIVAFVLLYAHARAGKLSEASNEQTRRIEPRA